VEGAHLVPGFLKEDLWKDALVIQMVLIVEDIERHQGHFYVRDQETGGVRSLEKYVKNLEKIRRVQDYLVQAARSSKVPVIDNQNIDDAVKTVMGIVLETVDKYQKSSNLEIEVN
ncbi:MAG: hypothetical protein WC828_09625, partial [Thermoleophilia bacterium]